MSTANATTNNNNTTTTTSNTKTMPNANVNGGKVEGHAHKFAKNKKLMAGLKVLPPATEGGTIAAAAPPKVQQPAATVAAAAAAAAFTTTTTTSTLTTTRHTNNQTLTSIKEESNHTTTTTSSSPHHTAKSASKYNTIVQRNYNYPLNATSRAAIPTPNRIIRKVKFSASFGISRPSRRNFRASRNKRADYKSATAALTATTTMSTKPHAKSILKVKRILVTKTKSGTTNAAISQKIKVVRQGNARQEREAAALASIAQQFTRVPPGAAAESPPANAEAKQQVAADLPPAIKYTGIQCVSIGSKVLKGAAAAASEAPIEVSVGAVRDTELSGTNHSTRPRFLTSARTIGATHIPLRRFSPLPAKSFNLLAPCFQNSKNIYQPRSSSTIFSSSTIVSATGSSSTFVMDPKDNNNKDSDNDKNKNKNDNKNDNSNENKNGKNNDNKNGKNNENKNGNNNENRNEPKYENKNENKNEGKNENRNVNQTENKNENWHENKNEGKNENKIESKNEKKVESKNEPKSDVKTESEIENKNEDKSKINNEKNDKQSDSKNDNSSAEKMSKKSNRNKNKQKERNTESSDDNAPSTSTNTAAARKRKINEETSAKTSSDAAAAAGPVTSTQPAEEDKDKEEDKDAKKKKNRCAECRKKVGLTGFQCRCGGLYCAVHRYSDKHDCTFNYREHGAQEIRRNNPVVVGEKIQKI